MKKLIFLFLITCGYLTAQVTTSSISGVIVDDANIELEGANVVATHIPTGTTYGAVTNQDGRFNMVNMRVGGPYTVSISYIGFNQQDFDNIFLTLGKSETISLAMTPDSQELKDVVVTANASDVFSSNRTGARTSVGRRQLSTLPSISRAAADYTRLEPTASNGSFGGRNDQFNNYSLDGAIFNNPFGLDAATPGGQTEAQPISIDAIEQITVSTAPYDVTQAGFTGASVNAVTKSGTNEFTGTVYGFYRNEDMTGSKIKGQSIFIPTLLQSQTGVSVGGPIIKNKLFFFANFEQDTREDLGQSWLPNRGTGGINESRVLESDLMAVQSALSGLGYNTGAYEGFIHEAGSTKGIVKLDWNINDNHRMALIYNFLDASKDKPAHPTALGFRGPNASILQFQNSGYQINNKLNSYQMELNSSLSDAVSNKLQVGYSHFDDFRNPMSSPAPAMTIQDGAGANYIVVGHEPFSINNQLDQKVMQLTNNLTYVKGDHTYTLGFSYEKFEFDNSFNLGVYGYSDDRGYAGAFGAFGSVGDFIDAVNNGLIGDAIAGAQSTFDADSWSLAETNVGQMSFYVQDEWFVNDKFKLTYGVRMDKPLYFDSDEKAQDVIDGTGDYAPGTPYVNPNTGQVQLLDNTKMPTDKWVISPRVGFNYDVNGDDTTQLRGGSGLFTGRFPFVWVGNQIGNPNWWFHQMVDPDYQFPQVWRTNLGIDQEYDNGLTLSLDVSYTKDINGPQVQNWGFKKPSGSLAGVDNRAVYTANDFVQVDVPFPVNASAYVFSNSDLGRIWNYSLKLEKTFDSGLYTSLAYNHLNAKDVNSIEAEITGDAFDFNPVVGDANAETLSYSKYGDMHRVIGVASQSWNYGTNDRWGSTITTFFEYKRGGRYSYTYAGDINGDGRGGNDLLYVPTISQVMQMNFANPADASAYNDFIEQDEYLNSRRGQYAERYGALSPWTGRWDVRFLQDYRIKRASGKTNVIQFSLDILNFGNLISSDWGLVQQPNSIQPVSVNVTGDVPTYTFDSNLVDSFVYDSSLNSRWQMQFGLRYIF
ncbi:MAG: carboxypeptidase regulatory-like domain-containing protein [Flavobacteriales bacterium]|nr:carboxypeptidase regulatory-like domain-containing protein [Flavobacteriales bacterium]